MTPRYAREDFKGPLERVGARVDEAIEGLAGYNASHTWGRAVRAMLAISRAPKHLIRAQLVLLGSLAGGGRSEDPAIERFATGLELLHLFMLVHDDVMDNATLRRGRPTLRVALQAAEPDMEWQTARDLAILMGNLLHVLAMKHLDPSDEGGPGRRVAREIVLDASCRAGVGQFHDLLGFRGIGDDEEALRREIVDKSAHHSVAAPLAAGLLLANPSADPAPAFVWGHRMGVAFQAVDDLTDLVASPAITGKDGLRDLLEGRPSLPLFLLRRRAASEDRAFLESLLGRRAIEPGERARLNDLIVRMDVVPGCAEWVRSEIASAAASREGSGFPVAAQEGLRAFERDLAGYVDDVSDRAARDHGE